MAKTVKIEIDLKELKQKLKLIKTLSGVEDNLSSAIEYALFYANSSERETIAFIQEILRGLASGTIRLNFNIFELYKKV